MTFSCLHAVRIGGSNESNLRAGLTCLAIAFIFEPSFTVLIGQQRLPGGIDNQRKTILRGSRNRRIEGLVSEAPLRIPCLVNAVTFRFKPTSEQEAQLERLVEDQQDPSSPSYHAWLSPGEYGERFGVRPDDYLKVREWIPSQGFQVDYAGKSQTHISFSGTARQVRKTFGTELHYYRINGKRQFANQFEIEIPRDLEELVYAVRGLDDLPEEAAGKIIPRATNSGTGGHGITPGDLAVIYNLDPLYKQGINGAGQKIVVAGESGINIQDVRKFRETLGLPPNDPRLFSRRVWGPGAQRSPGRSPSGRGIRRRDGSRRRHSLCLRPECGAGGRIRGRPEPCADHQLQLCELRKTEHGLLGLVSQRRAAGGRSRDHVGRRVWRYRSGGMRIAIEGLRRRQRDRREPPGQRTRSDWSRRNRIRPKTTAITGRQQTPSNGTSARSYIPERAWNDSGNGKLLAASGGGVSAAYPRPDWQTGPGVPNDNARHVPDIAFTASRDHDPYLIVMSRRLRDNRRDLSRHAILRRSARAT